MVSKEIVIKNVTKKGNVMKNMKLLAIVMLLGLQDFVHANVTVAAGSKITVINSSDMPIKANWVGTSNKTGVTSALIAPGATGSLVYQADTIVSITVTYFKADGTTARDAVPLSFSPTVMAKTLYVYGSNAIEIGALDMTVPANPVPARCVAWWTGNIDTAKYPTAAAAIADAPAMAALVNMYMISVDGKNTILPAF
jgi:hypothetical protein